MWRGRSTKRGEMARTPSRARANLTPRRCFEPLTRTPDRLETLERECERLRTSEKDLEGVVDAFRRSITPPESKSDKTGAAGLHVHAWGDPTLNPPLVSFGANDPGPFSELPWRHGEGAIAPSLSDVRPVVAQQKVKPNLKSTRDSWINGVILGQDSAFGVGGHFTRVCHGPVPRDPSAVALACGTGRC